MKGNWFSKLFGKKEREKSVLMTARVSETAARAKKREQGEYGDKSVCIVARTDRHAK